MKKICCLFAALLALLLSGCADVRPAPPLPSATAEYTAAWPQNALTAQIPRPDGGSVQYILDDSANGRCLIAMEGISEEETAAIVERFKTLVEQNGTLDEMEEMGKRKLAYEINYLSEGYYVLIKFTSAPEFPAELDRILGITDGVIRSLITRRPE